MAARVSAKDFQEKVLQSDKPVVVDFYSDSCVACKKLSPVLGDLEDNYEDKLNIYKLNTGFDGDLAVEYSVMSNPTLILFKDGEVVAKQVGAVNYDELSAWVDGNL